MRRTPSHASPDRVPALPRRRRTIAGWALLTAGTLALAACGTDPNSANNDPLDAGTDAAADAVLDVDDVSPDGAIDGGDTDPQDTDRQDTDPVDADLDADPSDSDAGPADVRQDTTDTDPDVVPQPSSWCVPNGVPYDVTYVPTQPIGVVDACAAGVDAEPGSEAEVVETIVVSDDLRTITVDSASSSGATSHDVFELFEDGSVYRLTDAGFEGFYSTGYGVTTYTFDERGRLIHKLAQSLQGPEGPVVEELEKTQTWEGDQLVSRVEVNGLTEQAVRTFEWTYDDDGALTSANLAVAYDDVVRTYSADWEVSEGRPLSVTRTIDGFAYETESWQWNGDQLTGRLFSTTSSRDLRDAHGDVIGDWTWPGGLDDFEIAPQNYAQSDPWPAATVILLDDCAIVPRGPGHGYPAAEGFYELGVPTDDRMSGIGFMYGNDGFGWGYGDQAWYGHQGLGTSWFGYPSGEFPSIDSEIEYDAQLRMISESTQSTGPEATSARLATTRTRTFDDIGIVSDHVVFDEYGVISERELAWAHDTLGQLERRDLRHGDTLVETQTWLWLGRSLTHLIEATQGELHASSWFGSFRLPIAANSTPAWTYDDAGAWIERESGVSANGDPSSVESRVFDDEGRLMTQQTSSDTRTYTYDDDGREISECYDSGTTFCYLTDYDERGRVTQRAVDQNGGAEPVVQFSSALSCESAE